MASHAGEARQTRLVPDVLITASCARDARIWAKAASYIQEFIDPKTIYVVVPDCDYPTFESIRSPNTKVYRESHVLRDILPPLDEAIKQANNEVRRGWYVQQFAKLALLFELGQDGRYLIWDSDTVPLRELSFWTPDGEPCFYTGDEIHPPYFESIFHALGIDKQVDFSFIAQCLPTSFSDIKLLRGMLETGSESWFQRLIRSIDFSEFSGFSEYEMIGTFLASRSPNELLKQKGQWSRDGKTRVQRGVRHPTITRDEFQTLDYITCEHWAQSRMTFSSNPVAFSSNWIKRQVQSLRDLLGRKKRALLRQNLREDQPDDLLREALATNYYSLLQVGACDGLTEDPVNPAVNSGSFEVLLVEPVRELIPKLRQTYANLENVRVEVCAAGATTTEREIFFIPSTVALEMNGEGPKNNWALGQGSFFRSVIVCSIFRNSFRGASYSARIPEWISSIRSERIKVRRTADLARLLKTRPWGLVLDVQGAELEVLQGLDRSDLPDWIYMETDGSADAHRLIDACNDLGFQLIAGGANSFLRKRASDGEGLAQHPTSHVPSKAAEASS